MRRRKHQRANGPALRLPAEAFQAVSQLANSTGWAINEALAFVVRAGWNALNSAADRIPALRQVMTAAVSHHETELAMRKRLAITAEKLRAARKALDTKAGGTS